MNAQQNWKYHFQNYRQCVKLFAVITAADIRDDMKSLRREAALERRIARLQRELAAAQGTITQLQDQVWKLEAQDHNRDDGNEWEKEYYLRGMYRR